MDLKDVDIVLIEQVKPDPTGVDQRDLPEQSECSDSPYSRALQTFKEMDKEFYSNPPEVPDHFEGLYESAVKNGLSVKIRQNPIQPPSRRVYAAIGVDDILVLMSMWVIWLFSDKGDATRNWLMGKAESIWSRMVSGDDPNAGRLLYFDADGPIEQDYSLTLTIIASLPNDRSVRLLFKDGCSLEEFRTTLSLYLDYVEHHWDRSEDADSNPSLICLALGENGQLVEVDNIVRTRRGRRRIEPTV